MRDLTRNKQAVYYALYAKAEDTTDDYGNVIGTVVTYGDVNLLMANVSPAKGDAELQQFGINEDYTRTVSTTKVLPIDKASVMWVGLGRLSAYDSADIYTEGDTVIKDGKIVRFDGAEFVTVPHNHVVVRVAKSINSTTYAIKEVNVT